eukprot:NODE_802_length_4111_cov_0.316301.p4 type:complete len:157 gc:universal NODE_802_length_4111_cov_0.316301:934-1404(+)
MIIPFTASLLVYQILPYVPHVSHNSEWWYSYHTPLLLCALSISLLNKIPDWNLTLGHGLIFWCFGAFLNLDLLWMSMIIASVVQVIQDNKKELQHQQSIKYIEFYPFIGVYAGSFAIPFDWDIHWQYFPYLSLILALATADLCLFYLWSGNMQKLK